MSLFAAASKTVRTLKDAGHEAWVVGGSVRDRLLGVAVEDLSEFDIATAARPDQVEELFRRTFAVGRAFGVVRVGLGDHWFDVATFRTETGYADGRHPDDIQFSTAEEDVQRRDFTVNGLLWDPESGEILDHVGGIPDLRDRLIRCIGDPDERFSEDALRVLRAIRFGCWNDFQLTDETRAAIRRHVGGLRAVSAERVRDELVKISTRAASRPGDGWRLLAETGVAEILLGVPPDPIQDAEDASVIDGLKHRDLALFLAAANRRTIPVGAPPIAGRQRGHDVAESLRLSTEERGRLSALLAARSRYRDLREDRPVRLRLAATRPEGHLHEDLLRAEGDGDAVLDLLQRDRKLRGANRPPPLLDGGILIAHGVQPGPRVGHTLRQVRVRQLAGTLTSTDEALAWLGLSMDSEG